MSVKGLEELAELAIATLRDVIGDLDPSDTRIVQGRLAAGALASFSRVQQTQGAREAFRFGMADRVLSDDEVAEYIKIAMPDHKAVGILKSRRALSAKS